MLLLLNTSAVSFMVVSVQASARAGRVWTLKESREMEMLWLRMRWTLTSHSWFLWVWKSPFQNPLPWPQPFIHHPAKDLSDVCKFVDQGLFPFTARGEPREEPFPMSFPTDMQSRSQPSMREDMAWFLQTKGFANQGFENHVEFSRELHWCWRKKGWVWRRAVVIQAGCQKGENHILETVQAF